MRKIILLLALVAALSTACQAQVNRTLYCYNATAGWIPLLSGASGGGSAAQSYPAVSAYASSLVDGTNVALQCDAKGNLITGGSVSPALASIQADTRSTSGYVMVAGSTTAAATVDAYAVIYQKTSVAGLTLTLETPTSTSAATYLFNDNGNYGYILQDAASTTIATVKASDWLNLLWSGSTWQLVSQDNGSLPTQISGGGTGASTAAGARANLGLSYNYIAATRTASQTTNLTAGSAVLFTSVVVAIGSDISLNTTTGVFTLAAGHTYELRGSIPAITTSNSGNQVAFQWYNVTTSSYIGSAQGIYAPVSGGYNMAAGIPIADIAVSGTAATVKLNLIYVSQAISAIGSNVDFGSATMYPYATIRELW